jgi:ribosome-binding protein aMBF1 (putative translation factor)
MKTKHISLKSVLAKKLKNSEFKFYFDESRALSQLCASIAKKRQEEHMTQSELAQREKTTQSVIARLENGNNGKIPSIDLLGRIAKALKLHLVVGFEQVA